MKDPMHESSTDPVPRRLSRTEIERKWSKKHNRFLEVWIVDGEYEYRIRESLRNRKSAVNMYVPPPHLCPSLQVGKSIDKFVVRMIKASALSDKQQYTNTSTALSRKADRGVNIRERRSFDIEPRKS